MNYEFEGFAPQGWQCPICKRVYSPMTVMCYCCGNGKQIYTTSTGSNPRDIRDFAWMFSDDITFCQEECEMTDCPRNKKNIRDKTIPHSFSVEIPQDCPKKE